MSVAGARDSARLGLVVEEGPFWPFQPGGVVQCPILPRRKEDISQVSAFTTSHFNLPPRSSTSQPLDERSFMLVKFKAVCLLDQIT